MSIVISFVISYALTSCSIVRQTTFKAKSAVQQCVHTVLATFDAPAGCLPYGYNVASVSGVRDLVVSGPCGESRSLAIHKVVSPRAD